MIIHTVPEIVTNSTFKTGVTFTERLCWLTQMAVIFQVQNGPWFKYLCVPAVVNYLCNSLYILAGLPGSELFLQMLMLQETLERLLSTGYGGTGSGKTHERSGCQTGADDLGDH
jgi:hypothetical protein